MVSGGRMALGVDPRFVLLCLGVAGAYVAIVYWSIELLADRLQLTALIPPEMLESQQVGWRVMGMVMELLFYVLVPTLLFSFLYAVLPFSSIRSGLAAGLFATVLGASPIVMQLTARVKIPMSLLLLFLFGHLLKLGGSLAIISRLYAP